MVEDDHLVVEDDHLVVEDNHLVMENDYFVAHDPNYILEGNPDCGHLVMDGDQDYDRPVVEDDPGWEPG